MLSVKRSNVRSVAALGTSQPSRPQRRRQERSELKTRALRKGDEVVVQGLTKAVEYNGQRALVTATDPTDPTGRVTVELLRSGRQMSLRRDKLRVMVELSDSEADSEDDLADLPPLRCIRPNMKQSKFQIGQKVWLHMKQKPEYHGQQVFVLPSDPLKVTAERRRKRHEHLQGLAEESKRRIADTGCGAWHQVLNVAKEATLQEVKQAFRDLALLHHPDKGLESCNETFRIVRGAYQRALAFFQEKDQVGT
eukprot:s311_g15.t1